MKKVCAALLLLGVCTVEADDAPVPDAGPSLQTELTPQPEQLPEPPHPDTLENGAGPASPVPAPSMLPPGSHLQANPCPAPGLGYGGPVNVPGATVYSFRPYGGAYGHPPAMPPAGYTGAAADGFHTRYPYYSYRRPWYTPGPASANVNILW